MKLLNYGIKALEYGKELKCMQVIELLDGRRCCACFDGSVSFGIVEL
jgi:hypothetical protein